MNTMRIVLILVAFVALEGRASASDGACPLNLNNAAVAVADAPTGVTVTITTELNTVAYLRNRLEKIAAMTKMQKHTKMHPAATQTAITYEPIEKGGRLTLTPNDLSRLDEFRADIRARIERAIKDGCAMAEDAKERMKQHMMNQAERPTPEPEGSRAPDNGRHEDHH